MSSTHVVSIEMTIAAIIPNTTQYMPLVSSAARPPECLRPHQAGNRHDQHQDGDLALPSTWPRVSAFTRGIVTLLMSKASTIDQRILALEGS